MAQSKNFEDFKKNSGETSKSLNAKVAELESQLAAVNEDNKILDLELLGTFLRLPFY